MKRSLLLGALSTSVFTFFSESSDAALVGRDLDGNITTVEAYYDDVAGLTWLVDANAGVGSAFDDSDQLFPSTTDGRMTWDNANAWVASLDFDGISGWRLPDTMQPDASCDTQRGGDSSGANCTGSEMGNLFYNVLGGTAGSSISSNHNIKYNLFFNIQSDAQTGSYWSSTQYESYTNHAWNLYFFNGAQSTNSKDSTHYAWAVHDGDVGTAIVPIPPALWLFGSGLVGLVGIARRGMLYE